MCVARAATLKDGAPYAVVVLVGNTDMAIVLAALMEDPATTGDRLQVLRSFHDAFQCPLGSLRALELATYDSYGQHLLAYQERVRALLFARPQIQAVLQDPQYVAALDTVALRSNAEQAWYERLATQMEENEANADELARFELLPSEAALATGPALNQCRKCGSTMVEWHQRQTRSADEGITTFCQCRRCGKRWRQ